MYREITVAYTCSNGLRNATGINCNNRAKAKSTAIDLMANGSTDVTIYDEWHEDNGDLIENRQRITKYQNGKWKDI